MKTQKTFFLLLLFSLVLPGCLFKKDGIEVDKKGVKKVSRVGSGKGIPLSKGGKRDEGKFYSQEVEAFVLEEDDADFALAQVDAEEEIRLARANVKSSGNNFEAIFFDFDRANIRGDQAPALAYDVQQAKEAARTSKIRVEGNSDSYCVSEAYNIALSEKRARNVAKELEKAGVPHGKIVVVGYGDKKKAIDVAGKEERNRRAEIVKVS